MACCLVSESSRCHDQHRCGGRDREIRVEEAAGWVSRAPSGKPKKIVGGGLVKWGVKHHLLFSFWSIWGNLLRECAQEVDEREESKSKCLFFDVEEQKPVFFLFMLADTDSIGQFDSIQSIRFNYEHDHWSRAIAAEKRTKFNLMENQIKGNEFLLLADLMLF